MPDAPPPEPVTLAEPPMPARPPPHHRRRRGRAWLLLALPAIMIVVAVAGILSRSRSEASLKDWTDEVAIPTVAIVKPQQMGGSDTLKLPGNVEAFYEAPIYARVDGYLHGWYHDIGAHVQHGEVLATIDTPDLDQQLNQAKARVAVALAEQRLAAVTAARWRSLLASHSVAEQTVDEKEGEAQAKLASLQAAEADVSRLQALESFKTLTAPFDGIVTARRTDIGDLIQAGSGQGHDLFKVADVHEMRVYVPVPQAFVAELPPGTQATLSVPQYPGRTFPARLATSSNAVNMESRTALFELLAPNPEGKLWPGTYAEVTFRIEHPSGHLEVPAGALIFQAAGPQLAVVGPGNRVELRRVELGVDSGTTVEIVSGVSAGDRVIDNPPASLSEGERVSPAGQGVAAGSTSPHRGGL